MSFMRTLTKMYSGKGSRGDPLIVEGSNKDDIIDVVCSQLNKIEEGKRLGKGTQGTAYKFCIQNNCKYVVKVIKGESIKEDTMKELEEEKRKTNDINKKTGLSPKVYKNVDCGTYILVLMDLAPGMPLSNYWNYLTKKDIDKFFESVERLHKSGYYHGDFNPGNIMIADNGKITFIDFNERIREYRPVYDYMTLLYFLYPYYNNDLNKPIVRYIYDKLAEIAKEHQNEYIGIDLISQISEVKIMTQKNAQKVIKYLEEIYDDGSEEIYYEYPDSMDDFENKLSILSIVANYMFYQAMFL